MILHWPGISFTKSGWKLLCQGFYLPSHFLINNLIWLSCPFVPGTDQYWKHCSSHLAKLATQKPRILNPDQIPPLDNAAALRLGFYLLPPSCLTLKICPCLPRVLWFQWFQSDVWRPGPCCCCVLRAAGFEGRSPRAAILSSAHNHLGAEGGNGGRLHEFSLPQFYFHTLFSATFKSCKKFSCKSDLDKYWIAVLLPFLMGSVHS